MITSLVFTSMVVANPLSFNVNIGASTSKLSNSNTVTPVTGLSKTYTANESTQTKLLIGMGAEYKFQHLSTLPFILSVSLSVYSIDLGVISGEEIPGSNLGLTDKLNYSLTANSTALMLEPRLIYAKDHFQPYLLMGAGYAWNTLDGFQETVPAGSSAAPSNPYGKYTKGNLAYEFGVGIQSFLLAKAPDLLFRLEYRYLNLGDAELGAASGQTTDDRFTSNNIATQIFALGISYQF